MPSIAYPGRWSESPSRRRSPLKFASTSDDIATIDYTDDAVTITLVENPKATPAAEPEAPQPAAFAEAPRLDAGGLVALQHALQKQKPGWHLPDIL
jgi:hypothetical protein